MSFFEDTLLNMGRSVVGTLTSVASEEFGFDVGGLLGSLFGNGQTTGGETLANATSNIKSDWKGSNNESSLLTQQLGNLTTELNDIGNTVTSIQQIVTNIDYKIDNLEKILNEIQKEQYYQTWLMVDINVRENINTILAQYETYQGYVSSYQGVASVQVADFVNNLDTTIEEALMNIHSFLLPDGESKSLLHLWSRMLIPCIMDGLIDYRDACDRLTAYYQKILTTQFLGYTLLVEANMFNNNQMGAVKIWEQYNDQIKKQEGEFITYITSLIAAGAVPNWKYNRTGEGTPLIPFTVSAAALELDPTVQRIPINWYRLKSNDEKGPDQSYYKPSQTMEAAEKMLASYYFNDPSKRRIVVSVLWDEWLNINCALSSLQILLLGSSTGSTIEPNIETSQILNIAYGYPQVDMNLINNTWDAQTSNLKLSRYVFDGETSGGFIDDTYTVKIDNVPPPMITYVSRATPFAQAQILNKQFTLSSANPFGYMNFNAYAYAVNAQLMPNI
ncbi:MAG: hypothetical protein REI78_04525 [Pedobacter sp.]|nr:hypothetical protein [Pedobacter sp.]